MSEVDFKISTTLVYLYIQIVCLIIVICDFNVSFICFQEPEELYEYIIEIEVSVSNMALIEQLKDTVGSMSFPVRVSSTINITGIYIIFTGKNL